ncbi:MAG: endopeptidase La [Candidatus Lightella neohaematopini]|nr:endopeptidase La [Candidatus Lightella neohaematopini]
MTNHDYINKIIPVLPLRDIVVYPNIVVPLFIGREKSIKCLEIAMNKDKKIMLVTQKEPSNDDPGVNDLFLVGTVANILQMIKLADGTIKILVKGYIRAYINKLEDHNNYFTAKITYFSDLNTYNEEEQNTLIRVIINQFNDYIKLNNKIIPEVIKLINNIEDADTLINTIATHMPLKITDKQLLLEINNISKRLEKLAIIIESEINLLKLDKSIHNRIKKQMEKSQKEYYLNEQIKAIQKELGEMDNISDEYNTLLSKIRLSKMPKIAKDKTKNELYKLKMMSPISAEATVVRSYIDWMLTIPWNKRSKIKKDLFKAKIILDNDHYGLNQVKEYILEYLAVQNRNNKVNGLILCLVGPPGVGKTSLGKSIAKATGRKYIHMSLGGMKDEAEIRGHRRTYIGSMPGKLIQKISKSKVINPVFLLDEIDKISFDMRGDPASALLEALDPEQNKTFNDNYLEIDYDLSNVMFIATANSTNIIPPLLDRMEIIKISGYSEDEKLNIARKYLIPKQIKRNALKEEELYIDDDAILNIIKYYTREAGVRSLEREISKICRKTVKLILTDNNTNTIKINNSNLSSFIGIKKFDYKCINNKDIIGQVNGLAWTDTGGDLLIIETTCVSGNGKLVYTGSLGKIMQESIKIALTVVRANVNKFKIDPIFYKIMDIHVHVPEGAIPKDGPSAGIAIYTALISSLSKKPIKNDIAMTGEITLNGNILPIGGLKEKLLAAHRSGIKTVLIPYGNQYNLKNIPNNILSKINIKLVNYIDDVTNLTLV